jgi:hypothetical protein
MGLSSALGEIRERPSATIDDIDKVVDIHGCLVEQSGRHELDDEFAESLYFRAVARDKLGRRENALQDLTKARTLARSSDLLRSVNKMIDDDHTRISTTP